MSNTFLVQYGQVLTPSSDPQRGSCFLGRFWEGFTCIPDFDEGDWVLCGLVGCTMADGGTVRYCDFRKTRRCLAGPTCRTVLLVRSSNPTRARDKMVRKDCSHVSVANICLYKIHRSAL